jgi:hypothetical protein
LRLCRKESNANHNSALFSMGTVVYGCTQVTHIASTCTQLVDLRLAAWPSADVDVRTGRGPARAPLASSEWGLRDATLRAMAMGPLALCLARLDIGGHLSVTDAGILALRRLVSVTKVRAVGSTMRAHGIYFPATFYALPFVSRPFILRMFSFMHPPHNPPPPPPASPLLTDQLCGVPQHYPCWPRQTGCGLALRQRP